MEENNVDKKFNELSKEGKVSVFKAYQLTIRATQGMWYAEIEALLEMMKNTIKISSKFHPEYVPNYEES